MAGDVTKSEAYKEWLRIRDTIQNYTAVNEKEDKAVQLKRIARARKDYNYFVQYYFPHYCTNQATGEAVPCASFHIKAAKDILANRTGKFVFQWARGHAKSTHMDIFIPMWLKCQTDDTRARQINTLVLVGKSEDDAERLLADIQAELQFNKRYIHDFGKQVNSNKWSAGEFATRDGVSFHALGRGQSPRGLRDRQNRPDYIVIDDLDDDELCNNESRVRRLTEWVTSALFGCFGAAGGRLIMVGNLIAKNSVLANVCKIKSVKVSRVNVIDQEGNPSWPEYWKPEAIQETRDFMGYRAFQREYMNNPITEGTVFKANWIRWKKPLPLAKYTDLILYVDPSFKPTTKNDFKAAKLWGKTKEGELHLLRCFCRQCTVAEMVRWLYDLYEELQQAGVQALFYMEANFVQDIILDEFKREGNIRGYQLPIIPDKRKKPDKYQRIEAVSPLWERGLVFYNENYKEDPDFIAGLDQTLAFEKGTTIHDDSPDADEGAIYMLQKRTRVDDFQPRIGRSTNSKYQW